MRLEANIRAYYIQSMWENKRSLIMSVHFLHMLTETDRRTVSHAYAYVVRIYKYVYIDVIFALKLEQVQYHF